MRDEYPKMTVGLTVFKTLERTKSLKLLDLRALPTLPRSTQIHLFDFERPALLDRKSRVSATPAESPSANRGTHGNRRQTLGGRAIPTDRDTG